MLKGIMNMNRIVFIISVLSIVNTSQAQISSQFRGMNRDGYYPASNLLNEWPEEGPEMIWKIEDIGKGFSSASVTSDMIYITGKKDSMEYLSAILPEGRLVWQIPYGKAWYKSFQETRCTPTVEKDRIYCISGQGEVVCIQSKDGSIIWKVDALKHFEGRFGEWGVAESPLIVDDKVIYTPGGMQTTMVAYNKYNGELAWASESLEDTTAYASPVLIDHHGKKQIVQVTARYIFGVAPEDGEILWKFYYYGVHTPLWHPFAPIINCNSAMYKEGQVYVTSGYNHTGVMLDLNDEGNQAEMQWNDTILDCHHGGVVYHDGYIFGSNWINNSMGNWCCIDWDTGEKMYETEWECKGSIILAGDKLVCYDERRGNVALVNPTPERFDIISTFRITKGSGPYWAHPVVDNGILYIRHGEVLMAYDLRRKPQ